MEKHRSRIAALTAGVFVTFLWSTSYILNKLAFEEGISPFMLAGLRYTIAVITLAIVYVIRQGSSRLDPRNGKRKKVNRVGYYVLLGITGYVMAQGLQYAGQYFVTPTQTGLTLSIGNNLLVLAADALWLREIKHRGITAGVLGVTAGILLYYYPWHLGWESTIGIGLILMSSVGYTVNLFATRNLLANREWGTTDLVLYPMLVGSSGMVLIGLLQAGMPHISLRLWGILLWLGAINGALAFYLWTWSQKTLKAYESSMLNNLVLIQVAVMDVLVLARPVTWLQGIGLLATFLSIAYVQFAPLFRKQPQNHGNQQCKQTSSK